jgi:CBS domain containing-hemolysin-like protein
VNLVLILCVVAVIIATYLSALNIALMSMSRAALEWRLEERGRPNAAAWLFEDPDAAVLATGLLRTFARMSIYVLVLAEWIGLQREATVTWTSLIGSGVVAAVVVWLTTIVLGSAIARHAGTAVIVASLGLLRVIIWICRPATRAGMMLDEMVRRLTGAHLRDPEAGEELLQSIEDVQREGTLDLQSAEILENVVEFTNTEVSEVMTPRIEIEGLPYTNDLNEIRSHIMEGGHSRIPVYNGSLDHIAGILYVKDLIPFLGTDTTDFQLKPLLRQPIVVPESKPVRELLTYFQKAEVHMAIVIDEYGGTAGLVTIEDVLEEIVGDIRDEHEPSHDDEPVLQSFDEARAEVDGRFRIDDLNERLSLNIPDEEDYDTIAGFVLSRLGRIPAVGESFEAYGARFTVLAATPTHVQRVKLELLERASREEQVRETTGA